MTIPQSQRRVRPGSVPDALDVLNTVPDEDEYEEEEEETPQPEREENGRVTSAGASELARARWLTDNATREDVVDFFTTCEMEAGLSQLARMREVCELAARTIEKRRTEETEKTACAVCGVTKKQLGNRNWRMIAPRKDDKTGTLFTIYLCSDACVIADNKKKYGIAAMSDRGMLPGDDPARAKNSIIAHQERVRAEHEMQEANKKVRGEK